MKASNVLRLIIGLSSNQGVSQEPEEDETDLRTQRVVLWTSFGILLLGAIIALGFAGYLNLSKTTHQMHRRYRRSLDP